MERRLARLIELIRDEQPAPRALLAERLGVSERTVRSLVASANDELGEAARVRSLRGEGYVLDVSDEDGLAGALAKGRGAARTLPQTPEERRYYLLNDLLWRSDWVTIDTLAAVLYVSHRTISYDLRSVEATLAEYGLELESRPYAGLRVKGPELARRICLAGIVMGRLVDNESSEAHSVVSAVGTAVNDALQATGYQISSLVYQNLVVHISVAVMRMRAGSYVPWEDGSLRQQKGDASWGIACEVARSVGDALGIEFPEQEIAYVSLHLAARQSEYLSPAEPGEAAPAGDDPDVRASEAWGLVADMVERVRQMFHYDLRDDIELRMNLVRHVEPLLMRLRYRLSTPNPLLSEIKEKYPLAYQFAAEASVVLNAHVGVVTSEEEIGYIALAFAVALERKRTAPEKKNVIVVCASGAGSARLLQMRFEQEFGGYLSSVVTCDVLHLEQQDFSNVDYVFSTVPIPPHVHVPVPVRRISFFFDERGSREILEDLATRSPQPDEKDVPSWLSEDLFFPHLSLSSKRDVLDFLCGRMSCALGLGDEFEELVLRREEAAPTAFGNMVAMPHPLHATGDATAVCVGLLDESVDWDGKPVRAVFLITVAEDPAESLSDFYRRMVRLFASERAIRTVIENQSFEALARELSRRSGAEEGEKR